MRTTKTNYLATVSFPDILVTIFYKHLRRWASGVCVGDIFQTDPDRTHQRHHAQQFNAVMAQLQNFEIFFVNLYYLQFESRVSYYNLET